MINQIASVPTATTRLTTINQDLIKIHSLQAKLKGQATYAGKPEFGSIWSPLTAGPFTVPVLRWIE